MHILHINFEFPPMVGGGAREAWLLYREIARSHQVTVLCSAVAGAPAEEMMDGIRVIRCPVWKAWSGLGNSTPLSLLSYMPSAVFQLLKRRKEFAGVDIINSWFVVPGGWVGLQASRILGVPQLITLCGADIYDPVRRFGPNHSRAMCAITRSLLNSGACLTAISSDLATRANKDIGCPQPITIIPMGIELGETEPSPWREAPKPFRFVTACRLVHRKGLLAVLEAFARIRGDVVWHLIGDGPERDKLRTRAQELGLAERVVFEGFVTEERRNKILHLADAFILCSFHEGQCQAILEAAACGLPVITGNVGGQTDLIRHEKNGLLVEAGNSELIALAMTRMMENPQERRSMREAILDDVQRYSIDNTAKAYILELEKTAATKI